MLHSYIRQEAQIDWLFKKYSSEEIIIIGSDDEDEDDNIMVGFMPSQLDSVIESSETVSLT